MSRSPETTTHTTGAPPAHRAAPDRAAVRTSAQCPPTRYEPYLDGLFTYCLSVLCDHDAAVAALGDALALAERRGPRGVQVPDERRAWLYALARWACLRRLAEPTDPDRQGNRQSNRQAKQAKQAKGVKPVRQKRRGTRASDAEEERRHHELALLAWPEAAGTTPEQREALELAVRHQLAVREVAAVLGMDLLSARELLGAAACEVERTRAALAVVETGACPGVARLTGDRLVLSAPLRRELVRHVDDCPRCRRTAERAIPGSWPGTSVTPAALPVLEAPRASLHMAMAHAPRARGGTPRFDRRGFPMDPKHHAARRNRLRARAVTTTVVVTVVAAPVLALGAAYRGAPLTGEGTPGRPITANEAHGPDALGGEYADDYENAGSADPRPESQLSEEFGKGNGEGNGEGKRSSEVAVQVTGVASGHQKGGLSVEADSNGDTTLITLRASGGSPVHWSAHTGASWLYLSQSSGTLRPGEALTIKVYVDHLHEPNGPWSARVSIAPAGAVVSIDGYGTAGPSHPGPGPGPAQDPTPSAPTPSTPGPAPSDPTPSAPEPTPTSPPASEPDPTPTPMEATGSPPPPSDGSTPSPQES